MNRKIYNLKKRLLNAKKKGKEVIKIEEDITAEITDLIRFGENDIEIKVGEYPNKFSFRIFDGRDHFQLTEWIENLDQIKVFQKACKRLFDLGLFNKK